MKKNIRTKILQKYTHAPLATKIRYSYIVIFVPIALFLIFAFYNMWQMNKKYTEMINSTVKASEFSLEFKKDLDYEIYLVIVGSKSYEDSGIDKMLDDAENVVKQLEVITVGRDNTVRLNSVKKYLQNLRTYAARIKGNLNKENLYEKNIQIWENDVQIVTTLVEDSVFEYIYYDIKEIEKEKDAYNTRVYMLVLITVIAMAVIFVGIAFFSYYIPMSISRPITKITEVTNKVASL